MRYDLNGAILPTGLETNFEDEPGISVYPNPFSTYTTISFQDFKENAMITLFNTFGESIVSYKF